MNIYDTFNQLERELRALPEYQAVQTAITAVKTDDETHALYKEFLEIQMKMQSGETLDDEMQKTAQALFAKVQANPLLSDLLTKEHTLQVILTDMQTIVFKPMQDLYEK
jgi:cell fate (sporulation/competence/biofilm development) regulator YlbF (YheA/YmcA/DUF963 family)